MEPTPGQMDPPPPPLPARPQFNRLSSIAAVLGTVSLTAVFFGTVGIAYRAWFVSEGRGTPTALLAAGEIACIVAGLAAAIAGTRSVRSIRRNPQTLHGIGAGRTGATLGLVGALLAALSLTYVLRSWLKERPDPAATKVWNEICTADVATVCRAAADLCGAGRQRAAEWILDEAMRTRGRDARILFFRGVLHRSRFSNFTAAQFFREVERLEPHSWEARCGMLVVHIDEEASVQQNFDDLLETARERPRDPLGFWLVAIVARPADRGGEGETAARTALGFWKPGPAMLHYAMANSLELQNRHAESLKHRLIVLETEGDRGYAHEACGRACMALKRYDEAMKEYNRAVEIAPNTEDYRVNRARCLARMGRVDEGVAELRVMAAAKPDDEMLWNEMGRALEKKDPAAARSCFEKSAELGSKFGMLNLAEMHAGGRGGPRNMTQAMLWMGRAASNGNESAWYWIGRWQYDGQGVKRDRVASHACFEEGARLGDTDCMTMLAWQLQRGEGVKRDGPAALRWYEKAAERGSAFGLYKTAQTLQNGWGVPRDQVRAFALYTKLYKRKTSMQGDAAGALACCHWNGWGTPTNSATGLIYFEEAAGTGDEWALRTLAGILHDGTRVTQDVKRARQLFIAAADKGSRDSLNSAAWAFATSTNAAMWDADRAIRYARQALGKSSNDVNVLDTLAAAYARAGRFDEAAAAEYKALAAMKAGKAKPDEQDLAHFHERAARYERHETFEEPPDAS